MAVVSILLITGLIVGMVGCGPDRGPTPAPHDDLEIRTWHDLNAIRDNMGGNHRLMNDLDSTTPGYLELASTTANGGKGWLPIGTDPLPYRFYGTFDGQGYEIRDMVIYQPGPEPGVDPEPEQNWVGLFGVIGQGSVVANVGVVNAVITGNIVVGGLAGASEGSITNSYFSGHLTGTARVGGLVGFISEHGTVSQCYSTGSLTGEWYIGGLVGGNNGTIEDCYSTTSVTGDRYVGGLVGDNLRTVNSSYSAGSVTGNENAGGLVGLNEGTVSNSFWDVLASGIAASDGGSGKTTAEMQDMTTFTNTASDGLDEPWEMVAVGPDERNAEYTWNIVNGVTYPFLGWQSA